MDVVLSFILRIRTKIKLDLKSYEKTEFYRFLIFLIGKKNLCFYKSC